MHMYVPIYRGRTINKFGTQSNIFYTEVRLSFSRMLSLLNCNIPPTSALSLLLLVRVDCFDILFGVSAEQRLFYTNIVN